MNLDYKMYSKYFDDIKYQGCMVLIMQVDYKVYSILRILKESYTWNDVLIRWDSHIINKIHGIPWSITPWIPLHHFSTSECIRYICCVYKEEFPQSLRHLAFTNANFLMETIPLIVDARKITWNVFHPTTLLWAWMAIYWIWFPNICSLS